MNGHITEAVYSLKGLAHKSFCSSMILFNICSIYSPLFDLEWVTEPLNYLCQEETPEFIILRLIHLS